MVKSYIAETVLHPHHMGQLASKGSAFIHVDDLKSGGAVSFLHFNKLKDLNAYKRNLSMGKRFKLTTDKVKDIVDQDGGSVLTPLLNQAKKIGEKLGKPFEKTVQVNPFSLGYDLGHDVIAPALMKAGIGPRGGKLTSKQVKKEISKVGKVVAKKAHQNAKEYINDHKKEIINIGKKLVTTAVESANGEVSKKGLRKAVIDSATQLAHITAKDQLHKSGIYNERNPYRFGQYKPVEEEDDADETSGSGFVGSIVKTVGKHASKPIANAIVDTALKGAIGGAISPQQQSYGLGGKRLASSFQNAKERMAYVRAHKKGGMVAGSMLPLGGSMMPL